MKVHLFFMLGLLTLAGCAPAMPGDSIGGDRVPPVPLPMAPPPAGYRPQPLTIQDDVAGVQEKHGATSVEGCRIMAKRFKSEGRKVELVDVLPTNDATLRVECVFEGEDAEPGYYEGYTPKNQN